MRQQYRNENAQAAFDNINFAGGLAEAGQNLAEADVLQPESQSVTI